MQRRSKSVPLAIPGDYGHVAAVQVKQEARTFVGRGRKFMRRLVRAIVHRMPSILRVEWDNGNDTDACEYQCTVAGAIAALDYLEMQLRCELERVSVVCARPYVMGGTHLAPEPRGIVERCRMAFPPQDNLKPAVGLVRPGERVPKE